MWKLHTPVIPERRVSNKELKKIIKNSEGTIEFTMGSLEVGWVLFQGKQSNTGWALAVKEK